jgi:cytochrome P450
LASYLGKKGYSLLPNDAVEYITNLLNQILNRRRERLERRNDFIQIMVDREEEVKHEETINEQKQQGMTLTKSKTNIFCFPTNYYSIILALNDKEILGQALVFLVAGYDTTSVLLSFFFYVMATEPVIQEKIYEEIQQELGDVIVEII